MPSNQTKPKITPKMKTQLKIYTLRYFTTHIQCVFGWVEVLEYPFQGKRPLFFD